MMEQNHTSELLILKPFNMNYQDKPIDIIESLKFGKKLMYFGMNFTPNFIQECWSDEPYLVDHLQDKFNARYEEVHTLAFYKFYFDLSDNHKMKLNNWIDDNYKG